MAQNTKETTAILLANDMSNNVLVFKTITVISSFLNSNFKVFLTNV